MSADATADRPDPGSTERGTPAGENPSPRAGYPEHLRAQVERYLEQMRFSDEALTAGLEQAMRYSLLAGGKRIRPVLALASARAIGMDPSQVLPLAGAIELIHTYSLIHDDLPAMDDDELRRGMPTCHVKYGVDVAILAGDGLYAEAFKHLLTEQRSAPERLLAVAAELAGATGVDGMVGGQYADVRPALPDGPAQPSRSAQPSGLTQPAGSTQPSGLTQPAGSTQPSGRAPLRRVHELKTGRLIAASVNCVLTLGGLAGPARMSYRRFAAELGVLFQIVDDILDVTGTDEALGKPQGSDERHGKRTYVSEFGIQEARRLASEAHATARAALAEATAAVAGPAGAADDLNRIADFIYTRSS